MTEPLLVVHGIANRDPADFDRTLNTLRERLEFRYEPIPVFWGDLGGISAGLKDSLPMIFPRSAIARGEGAGRESTRDDEGPPEGDDARRFFELLQQQRTELMGGHLLRADEDAVAEALYQRTLEAAGAMAPLPSHQVTRGRNDLHDVLTEAVGKSVYLRHVHDPELQQAVGELIADYLQARADEHGGVWAPPGGDGGVVMRGWAGDARDALKRFIGKVDQLIGKMAGIAGGSLNQWLRGALAEPIALTFGDIVAYHQRRQEIHQRLFDRLDEKAWGWGTREQPVSVLAHSLGGLVTLDAALGSDVVMDNGKPRTLHIRNWVTFGSQPAFFHVLTPRRGIDPYEPGRPTTLPSSIGRWVNLWHPLDILAFSATPVFVMHDGTRPEDKRVDTPASDIADAKGWLHSIYWDSPQLIEAMMK